MTKSRPELLIYGPVFDSEYNPNNSRKVAEFLSNHNDAEEIDVRINSPGGSASAGMAIYNSLKNHKATINVYIDALAASTAGLIAMGGDRILINNCAQIMIHNPSNLIWGDEHAMRKEADNLKKLKESVMNAYLTKVNISKEELIIALDEETTYTAEAALECGLATHIVEEVVRDGVVMYSGALDPNNLKEYMMGLQSAPKLEQSTKLNQKEIGKMTKNELKSNNPTLYSEIMEEGKKEERARLQALDTINVPGSEELVKKAKYETMESKAEVCLAIVDKGIPVGSVGGEKAEVAPSVIDPVTLLNSGKVALLGEETPPALVEESGVEVQLKAGNRLAELYNGGGK